MITKCKSVTCDEDTRAYMKQCYDCSQEFTINECEMYFCRNYQISADVYFCEMCDTTYRECGDITIYLFAKLLYVTHTNILKLNNENNVY